MTFGELRALPVGRGQIGKVKYLEVGGRGVARGPSIPASVIKTGVKLPQLQPSPLLLQEEDKPSLIQMRQELNQITTNISENPFMKNDMKKKDNNSTIETKGNMKDIPNKSAKDQEETSVVPSVQTDNLKKELSQVLQEMRKNEEESRLCENSSEETESSSQLEDDISDMTLPSTAAASDISQEDDLEREVEDEMEKIQEDFERAQDEDREIVSDIKAGEDNEITENEEEEISAL